LLEYPQYTRPRAFRGEQVPEVLVEGDHGRIAAWRQTQRLLRTRARRPDLWRAYRPTDEDRRLLAQHGPGLHGLAGRTYLALLHHPVFDRAGKVVTTAITNLDLHDIARAARTYGLAGYFVVTPLRSQRELARRIVGHWREGHGAVVNEKRREALSLVEVTDSLQAARATVARRWRCEPQVIATTAKTRAGQLTPERLRAQLPPGVPLLLVLGTGWGLTDEIIDNSHGVLEPLDPKTGYNHLSVRSAAAIILDRLLSMGD
jgi:tRNA (guanine37-N1)-methyltransferase